MIQVLRNTPTTIPFQFLVDETGTNPTPDTAVITITAADGTVIAPGTVLNGLLGLFTVTLAGRPNLDLLTCTATATVAGQPMTITSYVEIVGGYYTDLASLGDLPGLTDRTKHPLAALVAARAEFESIAERHCGVAFVPRFQVDRFAGTSGTRVLLSKLYPRTLRWATATDTLGVSTAFTTTNWRLDDIGQLVTDGDTFTSGIYGERNVAVAYEHGHDYPPPELVEMCKAFVEHVRLRRIAQTSGVVVGGDEEFMERRVWPDGMSDVLDRLSERVPGIA